MKLKERTVLITGGGRGIGQAIAVGFAREGADIVVMSRTSDELDRTVAQVHALGGRAMAILGDVSREEDVDGTVRRAVQAFGTIDILVNNAAIQGPVGPVVQNDVEEWINTIGINLIGLYLCTRAVLPVMMEHRRGKIINLSGGGSSFGRPNFTAYSSSKAAVVRFTECVAEEIKEFNIQVNAMAPGAVFTRMWEEMTRAGELASPKIAAEAQQLKEAQDSNLERAVSLAVFLASDESSGLTGRLISAVYDDWRGLPDHISEVMSSDLYTLRRVSPKKRG